MRVRGLRDRVRVFSMVKVLKADEHGLLRFGKLKVVRHGFESRVVVEVGVVIS